MSKRKLQADFIFNAGYLPPRNTTVHIVEACYGKINDQTIADGIAAIEEIKKERKLSANHMIIASINLNGGSFDYPQPAKALKEALEHQATKTPVVLLTHTNDAEKIYKSLEEKGCRVNIVMPSSSSFRSERFITTTSAGLSVANAEPKQP